MENVELMVTKKSARSQQMHHGVAAPVLHVAASVPPLSVLR